MLDCTVWGDNLKGIFLECFLNVSQAIGLKCKQYSITFTDRDYKRQKTFLRYLLRLTGILCFGYAPVVIFSALTSRVFFEICEIMLRPHENPLVDAKTHFPNRLRQQFHLDRPKYQIPSPLSLPLPSLHPSYPTHVASGRFFTTLVISSFSLFVSAAVATPRLAAAMAMLNARDQ